jgi:pimeloyl-ACP methyl ester carboxylesterase
MATPIELFHTDEGNGPPIVLVHGWTCDSHDWAFQFNEFTASHRVIAPDLRGHGRSPVPADGYDPHVFASDIAALVHRLGCGPVVAVGHSLGGLVVAALAVEHPDLVRATVAVDPAYGIDDATRAAITSWLPELGTAAGNEFVSQVLLAAEPSTPVWLRAWHRRRVLGNPPSVVRDTLRGIYVQDDQFGVRAQTEAFLSGRDSPVLAIHRFPDMARWEEQTFRHQYSHAIGWEGAGHWLHQERPAEFNRLTLDWIAGLPS